MSRNPIRFPGPQTQSTGSAGEAWPADRPSPPLPQSPPSNQMGLRRSRPQGSPTSGGSARAPSGSINSLVNASGSPYPAR